MPVRRISDKAYQWLGVLALTIIIAAIWLKESFFVTHTTGNAPSHLNPVIKKFKWLPPDTSGIPDTDEGDLIRYGRELIANTARYFGPKGKIAAISNGMNCQNCHLDAGTRQWGNNYGAVFSTYPKFRARSGTIESLYKRINDCIERSLNGSKIDSVSHEMQAISAYMKWLGENVPKTIRPDGTGIADLPYLGRAADTGRGRVVYMKTCSPCHGATGSGLLQADGTGFKYPPLWGPQSYTTSAGLYRISRFAGFAKDNMPFGASHQSGRLSDEEAWDVAAYVNTRPRPQKYFAGDWPNISAKPVDYPFGPYADLFSETQHKFGPFGPIDNAHRKQRIK